MSKSEKINYCPSCGKELHGDFCSYCGEKISTNVYSIKEFVLNAFEGFFNFDSKLFRSLKLLITKPGFLTNEFLEGRRVNYMRPFQLFLIINLFMILTTSILFEENIFSGSYSTHTSVMFYSSLVKNLTTDGHLKRGVTISEYEDTFNSRLNSYSQTLIFCIIPIFAIFLKLLNRKRYYTEHIVFSTHSFSYLLLLFGVIIAPILAIVNYLYFKFWGEYWGSVDNILIPMLLVFLVIYLSVSLRRVYRNSKISSLVKALVLFISLFLLIIIYKFFLFLIVTLSLNLF